MIPEVPYSLAEVCGELQKAAERGKRSCIVVVAEGAARAVDVRDFIERHTGAEARYLVLGHMQRGGALRRSIGFWPCGWDRSPPTA